MTETEQKLREAAHKVLASGMGTKHRPYRDFEPVLREVLEEMRAALALPPEAAPAACPQSLIDSVRLAANPDTSTDERALRVLLEACLPYLIGGPPAACPQGDDELLDWLRDNLFTHRWNGVVGLGCAVRWEVAPDFRFRQRELTDDSGIMAGDFRRAIRTAIAAAMPTSPASSA